MQPPAEQELAYFDSILAWQRAANNTQRLGGRLNGLFSAGQLGVVGHSMGGGLAAILAGQHPRDVGALGACSWPAVWGACTVAAGCPPPAHLPAHCPCPLGGSARLLLNRLFLACPLAPTVLLDPVDYTQLSLKVARRYLAQYRQPVLVRRGWARTLAHACP